MAWNASSKQFLSGLQKLGPPIQRRILGGIETRLLIDLFKHGRELVGKTGPGRWRFRVGDYRMRFDVEGGVLIFYRARHRRESTTETSVRLEDEAQNSLGYLKRGTLS